MGEEVDKVLISGAFGVADGRIAEMRTLVVAEELAEVFEFI